MIREDFIEIATYSYAPLSEKTNAYLDYDF